MNCGHNGSVVLPLANINGTTYFRDTLPGLPLQFIAPDANATRIILGPVSDRYIGMTTFQCNLNFLTPQRLVLDSTNATLTVLGQYIYLYMCSMYVSVHVCTVGMDMITRHLNI